METNMTEMEIIRASQQGDLNAFNTLILHYQDFLFRVAFRITRDENMASDVVQEACLLVFHKISSYRDGSFRGWLARIVSNVCYDELRAQKRRRTQSLEVHNQDGQELSSPYWLADVSANPETQVEVNELEEMILNCLGRISPQHQMILILIDIEEFSYEEAADALQVPVGTIKSRLARARMQMRDALQSSSGLLPAQYQKISVAS